MINKAEKCVCEQETLMYIRCWMNENNAIDFAGAGATVLPPTH